MSFFRSVRPILLLISLLLVTAHLPAQAGRCRDFGGGTCAPTYDPILRCSGQPNIGCPNFALHLLNLGLSFPSGILFLGTCRKRSLPLPGACATGCAIKLEHFLVAMPFLADRFGTAFFRLPLPNDSNLVGVTFCSQALRVDPTCLVLSNGLGVQIGRGACR